MGRMAGLRNIKNTNTIYQNKTKTFCLVTTIPYMYRNLESDVMVT
jgi:hypothetical protein